MQISIKRHAFIGCGEKSRYKCEKAISILKLTVAVILKAVVEEITVLLEIAINEEMVLYCNTRYWFKASFKNSRVLNSLLSSKNCLEARFK